ncbi:MAG TPA: SRPBCC domain-containing protein [Rhizomicrobium sp.]
MSAATPITLELTRVLDAPVERVFDAWLSTSWGDWAGPPGVKGEVTLLEPKVGGRYRVVMHLPDGNTLTIGGTYREIVRPTKIAMSWKWENEDTDTLVTLSFRSLGGKTELHLKHQGFAAEARRDSHHNGWTGTLDRLVQHLAKA